MVRSVGCDRMSGNFSRTSPPLNVLSGALEAATQTQHTTPPPPTPLITGKMSAPARVIAPHLRKKLAVQQKHAELAAQRQTEEQSLVLAANTHSDSASDTSANSPGTATSATAVASSDATRVTVIVPHRIEESCSPMELIQHQLIRTLQGPLEDARIQLQAATSRCDELEAENAELRRQNAKLHRQLSHAVKAQQESDASGLNGHTLCGLVSTEQGSPSSGKLSSNSLSRAFLITRPGASPQSQLSAEDRIGIVTEILETQDARQTKFEETIAKQAEQLKHLQARIDEDKQGQREAPEYNHSVSALEAEKLLEEMKEFATAAMQSQSSSSTANDFQARMENKIRQESLIDSAYMRETLLQHYAELSELIEDNSVEGLEFAGTENELWALRDRVVRRLALFEPCGQALEEAKAEMEYNGRNGGRPHW